MNLDILSEEIQNFINSSLDGNFTKIALMKNPFPDISWNEILNQIAAKQKAKDKLPTWFNRKNIIYPSKLSIEQTSSEITAKYKADLISGKTLIDLTGGFGVDSYYFSKKVNRVLHCEQKKELSDIANHNFNLLQAQNIETFCNDSSIALLELKQNFDWIYIDPSRRNDAKGKVFMLKDCLPNVPENLNLYFFYANNILIKTAPILDISAGLTELENVKEIHIVAVNNEVKELLWILEKDFSKNSKIKSVNIKNDYTEFFEFDLEDIETICDFSLPQKFLYEPNASILKSGAFDLIGNQFKLNKLHQHSHLYTSNELIEFPGRIFKIETILDYNKNEMKSYLLNTKANITIRNFPEKVEEIRKKWKIKDGGDTYIFFTTNINNQKIVIICSKVIYNPI